jgi:hypothetical protein
MTVEQRWILTHDGPYDLNGMPSVQTCELVTAVPEPVPQPFGNVENVRALEAKQQELEREAEQAREQANNLRSFRAGVGVRPIARPRRVIDTVERDSVVTQFFEVPPEDLAWSDDAKLIKQAHWPRGHDPTGGRCEDRQAARQTRVTTITIDQSNRGSTIATAGSLRTIRWLQAATPGQPGGLDGRLELIDDGGAGVPRLLWGADLSSLMFDRVAPANPPSLWSNELLTDGNAGFANLTVARVPSGARFEIEVG